MKVVNTKTRWYFCAYTPNGYPVEGYVEFARMGNGKKRADIYEYGGRTLLWSTTGVRRADGRTAKMAFGVYAEQVAKKTAKPMKLAFGGQDG